MQKIRSLIVTLALCLAGSAAGATRPQLHGVDLAGMDRRVAPGDDFYRYANGKWLDSTEIPPDRSSWGTGTRLTELTSQRIRGLIQDAAKTEAPPGSDARLVGDFYKAYLDEAGIEARGIIALNGRLGRVAAIADRKMLSQALGQTLIADVDPINATNVHTQHLLGLWVAQDFDHPERNAPYLLQGGLGMPDRQYYLDPSPRMADMRTRYQAHIVTVLKLAGIADPEGKATQVFELERKIAEAHASRADTDDVLKVKPWSRADFDAKAPGMDWTAYLGAARLDGQPRFLIWQPDAVVGEARLVGSEPLDVWKAYLSYQVLDGFSDVLPKAFADEHFAFYGKTLNGTPEQPARWKRAIDAADAALGDALGRLYVKRYFPAEAKADVEAMARNISAAFGRRIDRLTWMSPTTKASAKAKLGTLKIMVGYPDRWRDYSSLKIAPGDALLNVYLGQRFEFDRSLAKLAQPVDRGEWWMTPQTVNAVNLPIQNALNFPAATLQAPFYDPGADAATNYGDIGATIGHEVSHSFDDQGSQFDAAGRLHDWWTPEDLQHFKAASGQLAAQFDAYQPFPDVHVNGTQTLGENIADLAGLGAAYDAWRLSLHGKPAPVIGGLTGDQRFFIAYAQSWRRKFREADLRRRLVSDSHAPDEYRGDIVRNLDAWYTAFKVKPGQRLYLKPEDRVRMW